MFKSLTMPAVAATALLLAGCSSTMETTPAASETQRPASAPAPQPQAQAPAQPTTETIYFDFNSAALNNDARAAIGRVITDIRSLKAKTVVLTGHADLSGASAYNAKLAERRVAAVREFIQRWGVKDVQFQVSSAGEANPAVRTADGVREARNRRVDVRVVP
jgi:outer membrane protein OmpA-like peptidoglycan-associated protein